MGWIADKFNGNNNLPENRKHEAKNGNPNAPQKRHETLQEFQNRTLWTGEPLQISHNDCARGGCKEETFLDNDFCDRHMNGRAFR